MNLTVVLVNYKCDKRKLQLCLNSINIITDIIIVDHSAPNAHSAATQ